MVQRDELSKEWEEASEAWADFVWAGKNCCKKKTRAK
jgi:hypothetical protein